MKNFEVQGKIYVKCDFCGDLLVVGGKDLEFIPINTVKRSMGNETTYESEHIIECENCGNDISITTWISEYPKKSVFDSGVEASSTTIIEVDLEYNFQ